MDSIPYAISSLSWSTIMKLVTLPAAAAAFSPGHGLARVPSPVPICSSTLYYATEPQRRQARVRPATVTAAAMMVDRLALRLRVRCAAVPLRRSNLNPSSFKIPTSPSRSLWGHRHVRPLGCRGTDAGHDAVSSDILSLAPAPGAAFVESGLGGAASVNGECGRT